MGRVTEPPQPDTAPPPQTLTHFTHPHPLLPLSLYGPNTLICSGCKLHAAGTMYGCEPCNFILHQSCAKLPQRITHPAHDGCKLSLLTVSPYHGGGFSCDSCGRHSTAGCWSYHCSQCEYDLHVTCASKPLKIRHQSHVSCELDLTFKNPYANSAGFSCDICAKIGSKQWLYRCHSCEFDVHLDCTAVAKPQQPSVLQHHNSWPATGSAVHQHGQLLQSSNSGRMNYPPAAGQVNGGFVGQQPHLVHSMSAPVNPNYNQHQMMMNNQQPMMMNNQQPMMTNNQPATGGGLGINLMGAAMQGLVEGAFQGIGQAVVQEVIGGGDGGGGGEM